MAHLHSEPGRPGSWLETSISYHVDLCVGLLEYHSKHWQPASIGTSNLGESKAEANIFYDLIPKVIRYHFHNIWLVTRNQPYSLWEEPV